MNSATYSTTNSTINATPQDCLNLVQGRPFSARKGSIAVMYFAKESECFLYADRQALTAHITERDSSQLVTVREISGYPESKSSPAEIIAESVKAQLTPDKSSPLSPLAKERAVIILSKLCKEKPLTLAAYMLLFPYSSEVQFERLYNANKKPQITDDDILHQFADSRGCAALLPMIESRDASSVINHCLKNRINFTNAAEVVAMSMNHGKIDSVAAESMNKHITRYENSTMIERSLGPSLSTILSRHKVLARMVRNSNQEGAIDYIEENLGMSRSEAVDVYEELSAIAPLLSD